MTTPRPLLEPGRDGSARTAGRSDRARRGPWHGRGEGARRLDGPHPADPVRRAQQGKAGLVRHVVSVYDGQHLTVYLDGRRQVSTPMPKAPTDGAGSLKLGARGDDWLDRFFGGLDEVAVYGTALTPAQVDAHYVKGVLGDREVP